MKNSGWMMLGGLIGFSIVICFLFMNNKELKKEAENQLNSVLKTTGKLVRHYRGAVDTITVGDSDEDVDAHDSEWDNIQEASNVRFV